MMSQAFARSSRWEVLIFSTHHRKSLFHCWLGDVHHESDLTSLEKPVVFLVTTHPKPDHVAI